MPSVIGAMRLLSDESRVRILRLLQQEELSVADLQEILGMGQSRISMQLSYLKRAGFVEVRRAGARSLYRFSVPPTIEALVTGILQQTSGELAATRQDERGLELVLSRRKDKLRSYFDALAGRFGRDYVPGRSWEALCELLLRLMPPLVIADLGAGEGTLSLRLAERATKVIAVDNARKMVEYGTALAERNGVANLDYRTGDLEALPLAAAEVDLALFHQSLHHALHPARALEEAFRILKPGGRVAILDLLKHGREEARDLYADVWLGFSQAELMDLLSAAGFEGARVVPMPRDQNAPHYQALLAIADKPGTAEG